MTEYCKDMVQSVDEADTIDSSQLITTESPKDVVQLVDEADTIHNSQLRLTESGEDVVQSVDETDKVPSQNSPKDLQAISCSETGIYLWYFFLRIQTTELSIIQQLKISV